MNKKLLFIISAIALVAIFMIAATLFDQKQTNKENALVNSNQSALERIGAPIKGPIDAKVTIVEFFDPACGTCAQFFPLVNELLDKYPGKVKVMMRYAPLHQGSDQVVKMLEAAHKQGQFWPAVELLLANQNRWVVNHVSQPASAEAGLKRLNLDLKQFNDDINSIAVIDAVNQDIKDGQKLNVRATPEFFVNGKPMPSFGYQQLQALIEDAIAEVY